jgi:TldD protein
MAEAADGILDLAARGGASYADLRVVRVESTALELKDGELRQAVEGAESGFGLRVLVGGAWGFASSNDTGRQAMTDAVGSALSMARASQARMDEGATLAQVRPLEAEVVWRPRRDPRERSIEEKLALLREVEATARTAEGIATVTSTYSEGSKRVEFSSTEGTRLVWGLTRVMVGANLVARAGGRSASFRVRVGGVGGLERLEAPTPLEEAERAARSVERLLGAGSSPAGRTTVVIDPELTGVLVHEAFGHACEADLVLAGESLLAGRLGEALGSPLVSIRDDPTLEGAFGSFPFDDEGVAAVAKPLMERGVLRSFIHSRETAARLGAGPNGGARSQDHSSRPLVRMSNTYLERGDRSFEELLEGVREGIYLRGTRGGQVDTAKGTFQFGAQEAFAIEGGGLGRPLRDVALMGSILDTLRSVDAVGNDFVAGGPGFCGKGQVVPVGDGGPHVRIVDAPVGGM